MSASAAMNTGLLPPSSRVTLVRFWAAAVMISRPTRGLPVNMILSNSTCKSQSFISFEPCQQYT